MKPLLSSQALSTLSRAAMLLAAFALVSPSAAAVSDGTVPGRIPTVTRLVKLFLELEDALTAS